MALWGHFYCLHHGAFGCCCVGWFGIRVGGIIWLFFYNCLLILAAIGCFAFLCVLSEFLHVEIEIFTLAQSIRNILACMKHSLHVGIDFWGMNCNTNLHFFNEELFAPNRFFNSCTLVDRGDNFAKIDCCWLDGPAKAARTIQASRNSVSWKHVSDQGHCWAVVRAEKLRSKVNLILTQSNF